MQIANSHNPRRDYAIASVTAVIALISLHGTMARAVNGFRAMQEEKIAADASLLPKTPVIGFVADTNAIQLTIKP